jgi:flagellar motor switch protein FliN/FliY
MAETEQTAVETQAAAAPGGTGTPVQEAEFARTEGQEPRSGEEHLDMLLEIQLPVTISLGNAEIPLRRLLQMQPGSVLSLEKRMGDPVELIVQEIPFATGDIVVVDDCYAVRIREILSNPAVAGIGTEAEKKQKS